MRLLKCWKMMTHLNYKGLVLLCQFQEKEILENQISEFVCHLTCKSFLLSKENLKLYDLISLFSLVVCSKIKFHHMSMLLCYSCPDSFMDALH